MKLRKTDVAVIGAGTAGLSAYRAARTAGSRVTLIEGGPYGTTCARVGCMPSKLLIAAADAAHAAAHTAAFGVHVDGPVRVNGIQVMDRVRRERDRFVSYVLDDVAAIDAGDKMEGYARFVSDNVLEVGGHTWVEAYSIVIATGSSPVIPEMYRGLGDRVVVSDDVFAWHDLPRRILIVGTGPIALELGQALARLGVRISVLGRSDSLAGLTDPEVKASALAAFQGEFDLQMGTQVLEALRVEDGVQVRYRKSGGQEVVEQFDYILVAAGRRPNLERLELGNTALPLDSDGMPPFDAQTLQLGSLPVFLAGDVNDTRPVLHEAADDGRMAGRNAARFPAMRPWPRRAPLSIVFTDPQIAHVGARFKDLPGSGVSIGEVDFSNQGRSRIMLKNYGKLRVYADGQSGRFLGAEMAGPSAEHIGHLLAWALQQELSVTRMLEMPFYHPVIEESLRTALRQAAGGVSKGWLA